MAPIPTPTPRAAASSGLSKATSGLHAAVVAVRLAVRARRGRAPKAAGSWPAEKSPPAPVTTTTPRRVVARASRSASRSAVPLGVVEGVLLARAVQGERAARRPRAPQHAGLGVGHRGLRKRGLRCSGSRLTTAAYLAHLGHHVVCADIDADRIERLDRWRDPDRGSRPRRAGRRRGRGGTAVVRGRRRGRRSRCRLRVPVRRNPPGARWRCRPSPPRGRLVPDRPRVAAGGARREQVDRPGRLHPRRQDRAPALGRRGGVEPRVPREGTAVHDCLHPDRVVIGAARRADGERLAGLYSGLDAPVIITDTASAETIKYAANGFLAMKLSFINVIVAMCESVEPTSTTSSRASGVTAGSGRPSCSRGRVGAAVAFPRTARRS